MKTINKSSTKLIRILDLFQDKSRLYFQEIVERSGLPKTSVHRLVGSLEEMGFIQKEADRTYVLGLLFLHYGQLVKERLDVRQMALPVMVRLRDQVSEAVNLIVRDEHEAIYIDKVDTMQPVRVYTRIGRRAPLYAGACPRILLTYMAEDLQEEYLREVELVPFGSGTITDKDQLRKVLNESKKRGYSVSHSELEDGSSAVASPIFDHQGRVIAGLSVAGPEFRFQQENLPFLISQVYTASQEISQKMGWPYQSSIGGEGTRIPV